MAYLCVYMAEGYLFLQRPEGVQCTDHSREGNKLLIMGMIEH